MALPRPASCGARICTTDSIGPHEHVGGETRFTEPVVAPLPSEGWSTPLDLDHLRDLADLAGGVWDGNTWRPDAVTVARADRDVLTTPFPVVAKFCEAFDPPTVLRLLAEVDRLRRLVPEDDEDTVRVPREAVEALRRAHPARPGRDMAPVDHFLRAAVNDR